ncbi:hypothetical protein V8J82_03885 [Gymnodinialimonas sp. 2305UL16-5]|uniref:hypothetical protein n=1 Tax=Gymnodinialimonas mytili TaxID=3126503 RepID=UPI00309B3479
MNILSATLILLIIAAIAALVLGMRSAEAGPWSGAHLSTPAIMWSDDVATV